MELEGIIKLWSFYLDHISSWKKFNHITKDTNVFHVKSSDSRRLNHFPTFTLLKHTSHQHNQSIANCQFSTYKYGWPFRLWKWKTETKNLQTIKKVINKKWFSYKKAPHPTPPPHPLRVKDPKKLQTWK